MLLPGLPLRTTPAINYPIIHIDPRYYQPNLWWWAPGTITCGSAQADTNSVAWNG